MLVPVLVVTAEEGIGGPNIRIVVSRPLVMRRLGITSRVDTHAALLFDLNEDRD